jgi:hypothetical protein
VSEKDPYRIFVTHFFDNNEDYQRVFEYLTSRDNFFYESHSDPDKLPEAGGAKSIKDEFINQIKPAEVVIMPVAMYEVNPSLMRFQIDVAQANRKPILGIKSFGETIAIKKEVIDYCDDITDWNDRAIIDAIKRLGRNEETSQWEVIDFNLD